MYMYCILVCTIRLVTDSSIFQLGNKSKEYLDYENKIVGDDKQIRARVLLRELHKKFFYSVKGIVMTQRNLLSSIHFNFI